MYWLKGVEFSGEASRYSAVQEDNALCGIRSLLIFFKVIIPVVYRNLSRNKIKQVTLLNKTILFFMVTTVRQ